MRIGDVSLSIPKGLITAFIGPSGCGKSTLLRSLNRMNDLVPGAVPSETGPVRHHGFDLYSPGIAPVGNSPPDRQYPAPEPVPKSIFDNVAHVPAVPSTGRATWRQRVEGALRRAVLCNYGEYTQAECAGSRAAAAAAAAAHYC